MTEDTRTRSDFSMQQQPPPAAPPPATPQTQAASAPAPTAGVAGAPTTLQELVALRARREELSDQLTSAASRRRSLANQLEDAPPGPVKIGLEQRIAVLDARLAQLETDMAETGRQLTGAPAALIASAEAQQPFAMDEDVVTTIGGLFTVFVLAPLAFAFARRIWKRTTAPPRPALGESTQRLERIEQAIEAVAIEVERISEGQRFVTRVLTEGNRLPTLTAGKREQETARTPER
jgi:hypothetical protein